MAAKIAKKAVKKAVKNKAKNRALKAKKTLVKKKSLVHKSRKVSKSKNRNAAKVSAKKRKVTRAAKVGKAKRINKFKQTAKKHTAKGKPKKLKPKKLAPKTTARKVKISVIKKKTNKQGSKVVARVATAKRAPKVEVKKVSSSGKTELTKILPYNIKEGEEYMNAKQLEHFRNILLHWKEQLLKGAENTVHDMQTKSTNFPDLIDRASQEEEFNLELRTRDRERKLLKKIEEALQRIQDSTYGYCDECGAPIGIRRLEARPTATQCIDCKTLAEIRERQIGEVSDREE